MPSDKKTDAMKYFSISTEGDKNFLGLTDAFTKFAWLYPTSSTSTTKVVNKACNKILVLAILNR